MVGRLLGNFPTEKLNRNGTSPQIQPHLRPLQLLFQPHKPRHVQKNTQMNLHSGRVPNNNGRIVTREL